MSSKPKKADERRKRPSEDERGGAGAAQEEDEDEFEDGEEYGDVGDDDEEEDGDSVDDDDDDGMMVIESEEEEEEEEVRPPVPAPKSKPKPKEDASSSRKKPPVSRQAPAPAPRRPPVERSSSGGSGGSKKGSGSSKATTSSSSSSKPPPPARQPSPPQQQHLKSPNFKLRTTPPDLKAYTKVITRLKDVYKRHILPLEIKYKFAKFGYEPITDAELEAKAQVLLIGQYSVGKTTLIRFLLGQDFPGMHTGPEPTTDRFMAIVHGEEDSVIEGPLLEVTPELPYQGLSKQFGPALLAKFQASVSTSAVLRHLTFVDTPGILSGEKQRLSRQYDFPAVIRWLAERSDLVLVLFDVNKLDISDEFKEVLENLKGLSNKVRLVLNKSDSVKREELTRCYGAMMWSMSRVLGTPEVPKVNIGSFWEQPYRSVDGATIFDFERDEANLINDLGELSRDNPKKKVNSLIHRIHVLKVYMRLMSTLRSRMPYFGRAQAQRALIKALPDILEEIRLRYKLPAGDMPPVDVIKQRLSGFPDFTTFTNLRDADIEELKKVVASDLATLMTELGGVTKPVQTGSELKDAHMLGRGGTELSISACTLVLVFVLSTLLIAAVAVGVVVVLRGNMGLKDLWAYIEEL